MGEEVGMNGRLARWSGFAFVVLLLLQAGMADIPTLDTPIDRIQRFYASHGRTIVAAQIVSVAASIFFFLFAWGLARDVNPESVAATARVRLTGALVAIASLATAIPPISLALASAPSDSTAHTLTRAADVTDAVLFAAIALFSLELFRDAARRWLKVLSVVVAALSLARAVLGVAEVTALDVIGPLAFLALVLVVSVAAIRGRLAAQADASPTPPDAASPQRSSSPDVET